MNFINLINFFYFHGYAILSAKTAKFADEY